MSQEEMAALIRYRLEQADEALQTARLAAQAGLGRQVIGRAYYAAFYAVLALLAQRGVGTSKHTGVVMFFDREFVKTGLFGRDLSRSLHNLFDLRLKADYREMFTVTSEQSTGAMDSADEFLRKVREYLAAQGMI